jgi:transposase
MIKPMQGKKQYTEQLFKTFQLSQRVPEDNFYRRLKELLDLQWLYGATKKYYGTEGQQSIDPAVFFKLILIGYLENLGSDRRIINTVSMRLDMLFFIGYDIDEALPWHSTLSRTRQLYGETVFKELFKQILKQCIDKGMVAGRRQAMDSVAVKANASMSSLAEKEVLDDGDNYTDELNDNDERQNKTVSSARKRSVDLHHSWKAKAYKDMPKGKSVKKRIEQGNDDGARPKFVSNHTHYSTTDADARISVKPGKPRQLNYLAQVAVDTAHHVITHIQSDYASKKDSQCLPSLLKNTIDNLQQNDLTIEEVWLMLATVAVKHYRHSKTIILKPTYQTLVSTSHQEKALPMMQSMIAIPVQKVCIFHLKRYKPTALAIRCGYIEAAVKIAAHAH